MLFVGRVVVSAATRNSKGPPCARTLGRGGRCTAHLDAASLASPPCRQNLVHERKHTAVWDNYEIVKEIGHGMTGKVYQVRTRRRAAEVYAPSPVRSRWPVRRAGPARRSATDCVPDAGWLPINVTPPPSAARQVVHKGTGEKYALKCMEMRRIDPELLDDLRCVWGCTV
jgi:serine/threonine protein kinase